MSKITDLLNIRALAREDINIQGSNANSEIAKAALIKEALSISDKNISRQIESVLNLPFYADMQSLLSYSKRDLLVKFSKEEFYALCGANNPANIDFQPTFLKFQPEVFYMGMEDAELLESAFTRMEGVEWETIKPKIKSLNRMECYALQMLIHVFWNEPEKYSNKVDFSDYYEYLLK